MRKSKYDYGIETGNRVGEIRAYAFKYMYG